MSFNSALDSPVANISRAQEIELAKRKQAVKAVLHHAIDAGEAVEFLDMLGLDPHILIEENS